MITWSSNFTSSDASHSLARLLASDSCTPLALPAPLFPGSAGDAFWRSPVVHTPSAPCASVSRASQSSAARAVARSGVCDPLLTDPIPLQRSRSPLPPSAAPDTKAHPRLALCLLTNEVVTAQRIAVGCTPNSGAGASPTPLLLRLLREPLFLLACASVGLDAAGLLLPPPLPPCVQGRAPLSLNDATTAARLAGHQRLKLLALALTQYRCDAADAKRRKAAAGAVAAAAAAAVAGAAAAATSASVSGAAVAAGTPTVGVRPVGAALNLAAHPSLPLQRAPAACALASRSAPWGGGGGGAALQRPTRPARAARPAPPPPRPVPPLRTEGGLGSADSGSAASVGCKSAAEGCATAPEAIVSGQIDSAPAEPSAAASALSCATSGGCGSALDGGAALPAPGDSGQLGERHGAASVEEGRCGGVYTDGFATGYRASTLDSKDDSAGDAEDDAPLLEEAASVLYGGGRVSDFDWPAA